MFDYIIDLIVRFVFLFIGSPLTVDASPPAIKLNRAGSGRRKSFIHQVYYLALCLSNFSYMLQKLNFRSSLIHFNHKGSQRN